MISVHATVLRGAKVVSKIGWIQWRNGFISEAVHPFLMLVVEPQVFVGKNFTLFKLLKTKCLNF